MPEATVDRPTAQDRIRAALWFAERGFGVFSVWSTNERGECRCPPGSKTRQDHDAAPACNQPGKHPITAHGFHDATSDPGRIRVLLSAASEPNYGLVCPEGVFALDVDGEGIDRLAALEQRYGMLPETLRTQTANGEHIFLRWPASHPRPLGQLFGFVTRWGSGHDAGYVIGPRSVHASGAVYKPGATFEIVELPEVWAEAAVGQKPLVVTGPVPPESVAVGGRHDWLRNRARYYRGMIDDPAVLRATLLAENARLPAPKTDAEVERAIGDVFSKFPLDPPEIREERAERRLDAANDDELDLLGAPTSIGFPEPPAAVAFGGLLGDCVADLADGTDASLVGLLGSLIADVGALVPGYAYFHRLQSSSPFVALVGESSVGRKGTAMIRTLDAMSDTLEAGPVNRVVMDGLNSGEGLVSALYYKREHYPQEPAVGLVFEEEYATLLAARGRDGSTLDPKMRQAFDGGPLSNRRSGETKTVMPPYWLPALIGITPVELRHRLEPGALQSGSANRWLYLPVRRREIVPTNSAPRFESERRDALSEAHRAAQKRPPLLTVDPAVTARLAEYADFLPTVSHGLARDLTRRLSVIAFRVALVHALAERSVAVTPTYLERALALTEYARRGIAWVFGDTIGNPDADLLFRYLQNVGRLRQRTITRQLIRDPIRRQAAIDDLLRLDLATVVAIQTSGRPRMELAATTNNRAFGPFWLASDQPLAGASVTSVPRENGVFSPDLASVTFGTPSALRTPRNGTPAVTNERGHEGQNLDKSRTEAGQKLAKSQPKGEWLNACRHYAAHQRFHRQTAAGWTCDACYPQEETR